MGGDPEVVPEMSWKPDSSSKVLEGMLVLKILPEPPVIFLPLAGFNQQRHIEEELRYR